MHRSLNTTDFQRLPFPEPQLRAIQGTVQFLVPGSVTPLGSPRGAKASAMLYTLVETAKAAGLEPLAAPRCGNRQVRAGQVHELVENLVLKRAQTR